MVEKQLINIRELEYLVCSGTWELRYLYYKGKNYFYWPDIRKLLNYYDNPIGEKHLKGLEENKETEVLYFNTDTGKEGCAFIDLPALTWLAFRRDLGRGTHAESREKLGKVRNWILYEVIPDMALTEMENDDFL